MKKLLPILLLFLVACGGNKDIIDNQPLNQNVKVTRTIPEDLDGMAKISGKCMAVVQSTGYKKLLGGLQIKVLGTDNVFNTDVKGHFSGELKPGKYQFEVTYEEQTVTSNWFKLDANSNKEFEVTFLLEFTP